MQICIWIFCAVIYSILFNDDYLFCTCCDDCKDVNVFVLLYVFTCIFCTRKNDVDRTNLSIFTHPSDIAFLTLRRKLIFRDIPISRDIENLVL